jgi:hypothetical protein
MDISAIWPIHQGNPDRVNDHTPYPVAKGVWDYFAQDIVRAIIDASPCSPTIW